MPDLASSFQFIADQLWHFFYTYVDFKVILLNLWLPVLFWDSSAPSVENFCLQFWLEIVHYKMSGCGLHCLNSVHEIWMNGCCRKCGSSFRQNIVNQIWKPFDLHAEPNHFRCTRPSPSWYKFIVPILWCKFIVHVHIQESSVYRSPTKLNQLKETYAYQDVQV